MHARRSSIARFALIVCLLILALGALGGGWLLFTQPDGSAMGMPVGWLAYSPFTDYAIPGFILFALFGVGSLVAIYGLIFRSRWAWTAALTRPFNVHWSLVAAALIGLGQMIWITVQVAMTQMFFFLQPICWLLGLAILVLSLLPSVRRFYRLDASGKTNLTHA